MEVQDAISKAIGFAILAGAYRADARRYPETADTMLAAARVNSAKSKRALEIAVGALPGAPLRTAGR